ncbi:MAG: DUF501 domain-containing protein [Bacillota bacterium]
MDRAYDKPDKKSLKIIKKQLGREPDNLLGIARYCPYLKPVVIVTYPFNKEKGVFPTTYWLSCPFLVKEVSRLEDQGLIKTITDKIKRDKELKRNLEISHKKYAEKRIKLLDKKDRSEIRSISEDIIKVLKNSGVAGIRKKDGVKCLHAHLADYLVNDFNPVGKIVYEKLPPLTSCDMEYE